MTKESFEVWTQTWIANPLAWLLFKLWLVALWCSGFLVRVRQGWDKWRNQNEQMSQSNEQPNHDQPPMAIPAPVAESRTRSRRSKREVKRDIAA